MLLLCKWTTEPNKKFSIFCWNCVMLTAPKCFYFSGTSDTRSDIQQYTNITKLHNWRITLFVLNYTYSKCWPLPSASTPLSRSQISTINHVGKTLMWRCGIFMWCDDIYNTYMCWLPSRMPREASVSAFSPAAHPNL